MIHHQPRGPAFSWEEKTMKDKIIKILKIAGYIITAAIGFLSGLQF